MPHRLKNRNMQIPNGLRFLQPETNWQPRRATSFSSIVQALISHRRSRPDLIQSKGWSTDPDVVANEVDEFNANLCVRHGWSAYVMTDGGSEPPPKPQALLQHEKSVLSAAADKAKKIWAGVRTLNDWIDSGSPGVPKEVSTLRAGICATCPKNGKGDFTSWFTAPAADGLAKQLERLKSMRLSTPFDEQINICEVCLCPLKLKVHTPIAYIKAYMPANVLNDLKNVPNCWIPKEVEA